MTLRTYNRRRLARLAEESTLPKPANLKKPIDCYDFGFLVLCPEKNLGGFSTTVRSIKHNYPYAPILGIVGNNATQQEMDEMNSHSESIKGSNTITSLINVGMKNTKAPWNVIVFAGSWIRSSLYTKFDAFVKSEKDILFPVVDWHYNFVDGSMNGIILHRDTFAEVGDFPTDNVQQYEGGDLEFSKIWWALGALEKGCVFKAIVGMKI